jgi:mannan endo-1,4-beta-mannosidase
MSRLYYFITPLLLTFFISCSEPNQNILVDKLATNKTLALFNNLRSISASKVLFGHQETTAYGIGWVNEGGNNKSDVKKVCGDFPAIYGWDIGDIGQGKNLDGVPFNQIKVLIKDAYDRGGVNTISFHQDNPVSGGHAWDTTRAVPHLLPGGPNHKDYTERLNLVAEFLKDLKADDGSFIPVIFRPYHEHNGDWFWWGKGPSDEEDFIALWQFTVNYLKNKKNVHNLLYAFSPDRSRIKDAANPGEYLYGYPGDDYVDIIGVDNYFDVGSHWNKKPLKEQSVSFINSLEVVVKLAEQRGKIAALTETGLDKLHIDGWWSDVILAGINANETTRRIAYLSVWRNANTEHFHAPYPGHKSVDDFIKFYSHPITIFESELPDMYKLND